MFQKRKILPLQYLTLKRKRWSKIFSQASAVRRKTVTIQVMRERKARRQLPNKQSHNQLVRWTYSILTWAHQQRLTLQRTMCPSQVATCLILWEIVSHPLNSTQCRTTPLTFLVRLELQLHLQSLSQSIRASLDLQLLSLAKLGCKWTHQGLNKSSQLAAKLIQHKSTATKSPLKWEFWKSRSSTTKSSQLDSLSPTYKLASLFIVV